VRGKENESVHRTILVFEDIFVGDVEYFVAEFQQSFVSNFIPFRLPRLIVNSTVNLDNQSDFRTIKVDNVAINRNLAAEFQAEGAPISQQLPRCIFGTSVLMSHLARSIRQFL
jgi:hypothetical protein